MNSMANAKLLVDANSLPARKHENPTLAEAGVHQYYFRKAVTEKKTGHRDGWRRCILGAEGRGVQRRKDSHIQAGHGVWHQSEGKRRKR